MTEIWKETFGVTRSDRRGRRRYDPEWKALLVSASPEPGTSVAGLALEHGINANLLRKWIQKHKETQRAGLKLVDVSASAFIPVQIAPVEEDIVLPPDGVKALDPRPDNLEITLSEAERPILLSVPARMSVSLPNGVKLTVECGDVQVVTAIIGAVRRDV
jgi:transposase